jgi:general secretion pathway protein K
VLWLSAALAAIAFSLANTVRGEVDRAATAVDGTRAYYLAVGGVRRAMLHLLWEWQNPGLPATYKPTSLTEDLLEFPEGRVRVEVIPETSKLNLNRGRPEEIFRLLVNLGTDPERAQVITSAIVDWRGPPPAEGLTEFDQYYSALNPSFRSRHASFEEIEELLVVRGMTPDIFYGTYRPAGGSPDAPLVRVRGFGDCVSVFGATDRFDANTADPALLAAVGVGPDVVAALLERRRGKPFQDDAELGRALEGNPALNRLRVGGNSLFTLRATAHLRLPNGQFSDVTRTTAALVKFLPPGFDSWIHILRWYDTAWSAQ